MYQSISTAGCAEERAAAADGSDQLVTTLPLMSQYQITDVCHHSACLCEGRVTVTGHALLIINAIEQGVMALTGHSTSSYNSETGQ